MKNNSLKMTSFGNYNLFKKLCCGSVAEIFLAFKANEQGAKKTYVIKKFLDHISAESNKLQGFIKEGEIATSLSHQNIVYSHEFGSANCASQPSYYLAMDYVFGKNLAQINKQEQNGALPVDITVSIIKAVASGLFYAHTFCDPFTLKEQHITHKDVSPDNIIISYSGETKITDFGISQRGPQKGKNNKISGKLKYMSPEQLFNKDLDNRSDMYSLGVVFWECLTGRRLFPERNEISTGQESISTEVVHPCTINDKIPLAVGDICMKCLEAEPDDRFQSCQDLYDALLEHSSAGQKERKNLQAYLQNLFKDEFIAEVEALQLAQEGKCAHKKETTILTTPQIIRETTEYTEKKVRPNNPIVAQVINSAPAIDPDCVTMSGTITDANILFPAEEKLSTETTTTSDIPVAADERTTESKPKRPYISVH